MREGSREGMREAGMDGWLNRVPTSDVIHNDQAKSQPWFSLDVRNINPLNVT